MSPLFGSNKKEEEEPEEAVAETEAQSDGVQTYVMEPSLQETHELIQAVLGEVEQVVMGKSCLLYTSPSQRD